MVELLILWSLSCRVTRQVKNVEELFSLVPFASLFTILRLLKAIGKL